jgi:outer membrane lipoprotein
MKRFRGSTVQRIWLVVWLCFSFLWGCAHVVSKETLSQVDKEITFEALRKRPSAYQGKTVLLGGVIVESTIKDEGTLLEIYQTKLDRLGEPIDLDASQGRFLAFHKGFLDTEIYRNGRRVTVAGMVEGEKTMKLGEIDYPYPYLMVKEIYLWKDEEPYRYEPHPWGAWHPWGPWYDPYWYWGPRYRFRYR